MEYGRLRLYGFGLVFCNILSCIFISLALYLGNFYNDGTSMASEGGKDIFSRSIQSERAVVKGSFNGALFLSANSIIQTLVHILRLAWKKRVHILNYILAIGFACLSFILCLFGMIYISAVAELNLFVNCDETAFKFAIAATITTGIGSVVGVPYIRNAWSAGGPRRAGDDS